MAEAVQSGGIQGTTPSLLFGLVLSNFQNVLYPVRHDRILLKHKHLGMSKGITGC